MRSRAIETNKITAAPPGIRQYFRLMHRHRRLLISLSVRNLRLTYAGSKSGILSSFFQPIISLLFFSVFFGLLIKLNTGPVAYIWYAFSGLIIWNFFSMTFSDMLTSLSRYSGVLSKMYFPRMIIPLSSIANALLVAIISFLLLIILLIANGHSLHAGLLIFPLLLILTLICSFPIALWLSVKTLRRRDLLFIIPGMVGFGSWLTPVFYPISIIPEPYTSLIYLNPLTLIVVMFRWSLFGTPMPETQYFLIFLLPLIMTIIVFFHFIRKDNIIADYI